MVLKPVWWEETMVDNTYAEGTIYSKNEYVPQD